MLFVRRNFSRDSHTLCALFIFLYNSSEFSELKIKLLNRLEIVRLHKNGVSVHFRQ